MAKTDELIESRLKMTQHESMTDTKFDLIVLGGGNATSLARRAAEAGWRVALVEADLLGGSCPNRGCVPSKLLLGFAEVATTIRHAARFHMEAKLTSVDVETVRSETQEATIKSVDGRIEKGLPDNCTLFRGFGRFVGQKQIEVNGLVIEGEKVLVATGTRPSVPKTYENLPVWTSDHVFNMESVPKSIAIIGGGYIACELAWFFASVGVETTVLVRRDELLSAEDREIRALFKEGFCQEVNVKFKTTVAGGKEVDGGIALDLVTQGEDGEETSTLTAERVLVATGRESTADKINLDAAGIEANDRGFIVTDDHQCTSADGVYALGDVTGRYFFTHSAAWEATYLGNAWLEGKEGPIDYGPMPHAGFSYPEVAGVGQTEDQLEAAGTPYLVGAVPYTSAAKGRAVKERHGLCKFLVSPDGTILGCHIVGHQASVLLHEVIPVMRWRNKIDSLTDMIHIHPSLSEVVRNAARVAHEACRQA